MSSNFNLNALKGRIAEHIIQDLFINSDYNVFNYGLERLHPSLSKLLAKNNRKTSKALRFMPDFVVQSNRDGDLFYMEVKFRADGYFSFEKNYDDYPYKNAWFIIVSPGRIQCMHYKSLAKGLYISKESNNSLSSVRSFHIDARLLKEYQDYSALLFSSFQK